MAAASASSVRLSRRAAEAGVAHPAAGVDARPDEIAEVIGARRAVRAGDVEQRAQTGTAALAHDRQPLDHESAVEAGESRDVGHRRQRDQVEGMKEIRRPPLGREKALRPQAALKGHQRHEDDARRAQRPQVGEVVEAVGVDDHGRWEILRRLVMIEDDRVEPKLGGYPQRLVAGCAAIHRDEQLGPALDQGADRLHVGPVSLENAIGDVDEVRRAAGGEVIGEQRGGSGPIDVVVAEDGHRLPRLNGRGEPRHRLVHAREHVRVGHEIAQGGIEVAVGRRSRDTPRPASTRARRSP